MDFHILPPSLPLPFLSGVSLSVSLFSVAFVVGTELGVFFFTTELQSMLFFFFKYIVSNQGPTESLSKT